MKQTKRILSIVLCLLMLITVVPFGCFNASATQDRSSNFYKNYTVDNDPGQFMVNIALAQLGRSTSSMGYSEAWCANFVSDCARLAEQSDAIPAHSYVPTLWSNILRAGGREVYNRKAGDIIFYDCPKCDTDGDGVSLQHVGIVIDGTYSVEGNLSSSVKKVSNFTDSSGHTTSSGVIKRRYLRPSYKNSTPSAPTYTEPPTAPVVSVGSEKLVVGEETTLSWTAADRAEYYWISCWSSTEHTINERSDALSKTISFSEPGTYGITVVAINSVGDTEGNWLYINVYDKPSKPVVRAINCNNDGSVTLSWTPCTINTLAYSVRFYNASSTDEIRFLQCVTTETSYTYYGLPAGRYCARITAEGQGGWTHSDYTADFEILKPSKPVVSSIICRPDGSVTLEWIPCTVNTINYSIRFYNAGRTEEYVFLNRVTDKTSYTYKGLPAGRYYARVTAESCADHTHSDYTANFQISTVKVNVPKKHYSPDETVTWSFSAPGANYVTLYIYTSGQKFFEGGFSTTETYSRKFSTCGTYYYGIVAHFPDGDIESEWDGIIVDHHYGSTITTEPTCIKEGVRTYTCSQCNNTYTETIPVNAANHVNTTNTAATASTCTVKGYTAGVYCNDCKKYISGHAEQPLAAHTLTTQNAKAATCTAEGYAGDQVCTVCKQTITKGTAIAKKAHTLTTVNQKAAGCTTAGYTGDQYCTTCKQTITKGSAINALGHANTDSNGNCTRCGTHIKDVTPSQPSNPQPNPNACKYCGQVHTGPFGWLIKFFHSILAIFKR